MEGRRDRDRDRARDRDKAKGRERKKIWIEIGKRTGTREETVTSKE
jgi:hypothetical protein